MTGPNRALCALALCASALAGCGGESAYVREIEAWHADRLARLGGEDGWLTLVGLHPLAEGANTVGSAEGADARLIDKAPPHVGVVAVTGGNLVFTAEPGVEVRLAGGRRVESLIPLRTDLQDDTTVLTVGTLSFFVIDRAGAHYLRVKDSESPVRLDFTGIERFPVDGGWRVTATLVPHDPHRTVAVPNALGHVTEEASPGVLVFELAGETCSLIPVGEPGEGLFIVFADATTGDTTYGGGRFLSTAPPDADNKVVLDFNKATNPPCAFTPYATCPLPPDGNTLAVAVTAGEKTWREH
jgi:uncharacterized protein (DUF1684 family)